MTSEQELVIASYEAWLRSWAEQRTIDARVTLMRSRVSEWGLAGFTPDNVIDFLGRPNARTGKPKSQWTKSTYHGHLTSICEFLVAGGYIADSPMGDVRKSKKPTSLPRPLGDVEVQRILSVAEAPLRDWFLLGLLAGLRAHEIAKIHGRDVSVSGIYVDGKGNVRAMLPCHPELWAMAQRYPAHDYWFPRAGDPNQPIPGQHVSLKVGRLFRSLGIDGSIHRARHTFGTRLLRSGVHIRKVQKLMRHASLETTATYTAVDEDELQAAILTLPPVA